MSFSFSPPFRPLSAPNFPDFLRSHALSLHRTLSRKSNDQRRVAERSANRDLIDFQHFLYGRLESLENLRIFEEIQEKKQILEKEIQTLRRENEEARLKARRGEEFYSSEVSSPLAALMIREVQLENSVAELTKAAENLANQRRSLASAVAAVDHGNTRFSSFSLAFARLVEIRRVARERRRQRANSRAPMIFMEKLKKQQKLLEQQTERIKQEIDRNMAKLGNLYRHAFQKKSSAEGKEEEKNQQGNFIIARCSSCSSLSCSVDVTFSSDGSSRPGRCRPCRERRQPCQVEREEILKATEEALKRLKLSPSPASRLFSLLNASIDPIVIISPRLFLDFPASQ